MYKAVYTVCITLGAVDDRTVIKSELLNIDFNTEKLINPAERINKAKGEESCCVCSARMEG